MNTDGVAPDTVPASQDAPATETGIGANVDRVEDRRLLTGAAKYTDDVTVAGAGHVAFLRSQYGHARILDVDTSAAEAMDGVVAVITAAEIAAADLPTPGRLPRVPGPGVDPPEHLNRTVIAEEKCRHHGEVIAVVVAEDRYRARDAVDAIDVSYDRLDAVVDPADAIADGAPAVHEDTPDNVAFEWEFGDGEELDRLIDQAPHTV